MKAPGIFIISLDFELQWGRFDKIVLDAQVQKSLLNTRSIVPEKLKLFQASGIHATWATVGMLFNKSVSEWEKNKPELLPAFENNIRSSYQYITNNGFTSQEDEYHFANDLIYQISKTNGQEIATHTYSHYYCLEKGNTAEQFRSDLHAAKKMAAAQNIQLNSLVFPRNQYNNIYLEICREEGITAVRTNPYNWYWSPTTDEGIIRKVFRSGDAYLPIGKSKIYTKELIKSEQSSLPHQLPASRLYRAWQPKYPLLNKLKLERIKNEMTMAAVTGSYYHLWWHPENFGNYPMECMKELEQIVSHYQMLASKYSFQSLTMFEATQTLNQ